MSDQDRPYDDEVRDRDTVLGRNAADAAERRAALIWCLTTVWAGEDIDALQRWDDGRWHGWLLWRRQ